MLIEAYKNSLTRVYRLSVPCLKALKNGKVDNMLTTENPIEKYVGWTDTSSYFIFEISGALLDLENLFLCLKILPGNLWIDLCIHIYRLIYNIKHQITIICIIIRCS